jgi:hypothetical protein
VLIVVISSFSYEDSDNTKEIPKTNIPLVRCTAQGAAVTKKLPVISEVSTV